MCSGQSQACIKEVQATLVKTHQWCLEPDSQFQRTTWFNEPFVRNMPVYNLLMSASILMSGTVIYYSAILFDFQRPKKELTLSELKRQELLTVSLCNCIN